MVRLITKTPAVSSTEEKLSTIWYQMFNMTFPHCYDRNRTHCYDEKNPLLRMVKKCRYDKNLKPTESGWYDPSTCPDSQRTHYHDKRPAATKKTELRIKT